MVSAEYIVQQCHSGRFDTIAIHDYSGKDLQCTAEGSADVLAKTFTDWDANVTAGTYKVQLYVAASYSAGGRKQAKDKELTYTYKKSAISGPNQSGHESGSLMYFERIMSAEMRAMKLEFELAQLRNSETTQGQSVSMLKDLISLLALSTKPGAPVIAAPASPGVSAPVDVDAAFAKEFERWHDKEPDLLAVVTKLANLAESNPVLYEQAKKALNGL